EDKLLEALLGNYKRAARPVLDSRDSVMVNLQFSLMHIKDLDVRSQIFTTTGLLIVEWQDERLVWDPADYGNLSDIVLETSHIWRPEFAIYENYSNFRSLIKSNGRVRWEPGGVFKTMCQIDITYYPFDRQTCELVFGAWSYHTSKMNMTNVTTTVNMDSYKRNGEWQILNTVAQRHEFAYSCCPTEKFSYVARHTFYIMNVILPSLLTSVLLLSVFFCTPAQKVQIGVVVLLSFRIFLLNVAGDIPKTSDHIPLLGIYLTATMAITTLSMVLTVFVLNLHYVSGERPVPRWIRRLVLHYIGHLLGISGRKDEFRPQPTPSAVTVQTELNGEHNIVASASSTLLQLKSKASEERAPDYTKDWKLVAEVLDRLFFWLFLLAILITTLILFHPLTDPSITAPASS
ncbi:hypothetical protein CAPTEDRAFT_146658, partial [Capitella teleta]